MSRLKSWFYTGNYPPEVYGRTKWLEKCKYHTQWGARLAAEHCSLIHTRLTAIRRETPGVRTEFGLCYAGISRWPYAAIERLDSQGERLCSLLLVPCAGMSGGKTVTRRLVPFEDDLEVATMQVFDLKCCAVIPDTTSLPSGDVVYLKREDMGLSKGGVRKGDCFLIDTMHSPNVVVERMQFGVAANFGGIRDVLDTVRCRVTFAGLPSA
jgi:hypothetical protein